MDLWLIDQICLLEARVALDERFLCILSRFFAVFHLTYSNRVFSHYPKPMLWFET